MGAAIRGAFVRGADFYAYVRPGVHRADAYKGSRAWRNGYSLYQSRYGAGFQQLYVFRYGFGRHGTARWHTRADQRYEDLGRYRGSATIYCLLFGYEPPLPGDHFRYWRAGAVCARYGFTAGPVCSNAEERHRSQWFRPRCLRPIWRSHGGTRRHHILYLPA